MPRSPFSNTRCAFISLLFTSRDHRYSLSRLINSICSRGTAIGFEADRSAEYERAVSKRLRERQTGTFVPSSAFGPARVATRDLTTSTGGAVLVGQRVQRALGVVGWSAVIRSGAQFLGPLESDKLSIFHDSNLPAASWQPETGLVTPADIQFSATVVTPRRIAAQTIVSRQLIVQYGGSPALDEFVASRLKIALASALDQSVLYGAGGNAPTGILTVAGAQAVTVAAPPTWSDLVKMRFQSTNFDVDRSSFGFITSPNVRRGLEETAKFAGSGITNWDGIGPETEITREVSDDRIFSGVWAYVAIAFYGPAGTEDLTIDIVVDPFSRAERGEIILTGGFYCDVAIRFSQLFCYSQAAAAGP